MNSTRLLISAQVLPTDDHDQPAPPAINGTTKKRAPGSFFQVERAALAPLQRLQRPAIIVYLRLASRANHAGQAWPSIASLAADTGTPRRTVQRALTELQTAGLVTVTTGRGCRQTNTYTIAPPMALFTDANGATDGARIAPPMALFTDPNGATDGVRIAPPMALFTDPNGATHGARIAPPMARNSATHGALNSATHGARNENHKNEIKERNTKNETQARKTPSRFEEFWKAYPRKVAKAGAAKAYSQAIKKASEDELIRAAVEFAQSDKGRAGRYTPHPATWLNEERWKDDRATWNDGRTNGRRITAGAVHDPDARNKDANHGVF